MVLSVNSKNKLQILSINFALQDSIASMILETISNLNRCRALLDSINHLEDSQVTLHVYNVQKAIIVQKVLRPQLLALLDHTAHREQVITSNNSVLKVTS
jgi:dipeptidase